MDNDNPSGFEHLFVSFMHSLEDGKITPFEAVDLAKQILEIASNHLRRNETK